MRNHPADAAATLFAVSLSPVVPSNRNVLALFGGSKMPFQHP
jgi:hypothetical protein